MRCRHGMAPETRFQSSRPLAASETNKTRASARTHESCPHSDALLGRLDYAQLVGDEIVHMLRQRLGKQTVVYLGGDRCVAHLDVHVCLWGGKRAAPVKSSASRNLFLSPALQSLGCVSRARSRRQHTRGYSSRYSSPWRRESRALAAAGRRAQSWCTRTGTPSRRWRAAPPRNGPAPCRRRPVRRCRDWRAR